MSVIDRARGLLEQRVAGPHAGVQHKLLHGLDGKHLGAGDGLFALRLGITDQRRFDRQGDNVKHHLRRTDGFVAEGHGVFFSAAGHA
jgi:hypothetical protein